MNTDLTMHGYEQVSTDVYRKVVQDELQDENVEILLVAATDVQGAAGRTFSFVTEIGDVRLQTRPFALSPETLVARYEKPFISLVFATLTYLLALPHNANLEDTDDGL